MRIWQLLIIIVIYPILIESMFVAAITTSIFQLEKLYRQYEQSELILVEFTNAQASLLDSGLACAGLQPGKKNANDYRAEFNAGIEKHTDLFKTLSDINPAITKDLRRCSEITQELKELLKQCDFSPEHFHDEGGLLSHRARAYTLLLDMVPILNRVHEAKAKLDSTLPDELSNQRLAFLLLTAGGLVFGIGSSVAMAVILSGVISRRIKLVQENARLFAAGRPLPEILTGGDEIHELDLALHEAALKIAALRKREGLLLEKSSSALLAFDERLRFSEVSNSVSKILKYQADELRGRTLLSLFDNETAAWLKANLTDLKNGAGARDLEPIMTLGDGSTACIQWKISYKPLEKIFYCVALDITARRKLLQEKQELLTAAGQDISKPLSFVSSTISGINDNPSNRLMSEKTKTTLKQVSGNVERLLALVEDLLDLEKLESGKLTIRKEPLSAKTAIGSAVDALRNLAKGLDITVSEPQEDGILHADKKRLQQILTNLISNAIKYSPRGSHVSIELARAGSFYEISVIDQGPGIALEEIDLIFEKFYQTRNKSNADVKSTGLGLAIVKVLTTAQGGALGVESELGRGSRFWLKLPAFQHEGGG